MSATPVTRIYLKHRLVVKFDILQALMDAGWQIENTPGFDICYYPPENPQERAKQSSSVYRPSNPDNIKWIMNYLKNLPQSEPIISLGLIWGPENPMTYKARFYIYSEGNYLLAAWKNNYRPVIENDKYPSDFMILEPLITYALDQAGIEYLKVESSDE